MIQFFPTAVCNVTTWVTPSLKTARSLANGPIVEGGGVVWWAEGEVCILRSPGFAAFPISLLSMGGVGRQTCSLYIVLWLCDYNQLAGVLSLTLLLNVLIIWLLFVLINNIYQSISTKKNAIMLIMRRVK